MAIAHIVVLAAAFLALLLLPCVVAAVLRAGEPAQRRTWSSRSRDDIRALRHLDRVLAVDAPMPEPAAEPSVEQIAHDLRRLAHQRRNGPCRHSSQWHAAVLRAYDVRLSLACRCLGLTDHLALLDGMDRDLERLRVESELQAAGLVLN